MKNKRLIKLVRAFSLGLVLTLILGCERDISDDAVEATFSNIGDVFTDNFVGMGSDFYFPFADSKFDAFSVDNNEGYNSAASYRVDVPNANDATGNYAGAILRIDGDGRDLSSYDALTFWAKASQGVSVDALGFGQDFGENKHQVTANNVSVGTNWAKYTIPIPDASRLVNERGMFWYAAGTQATGGSGYVLWFDDIKFETLGTIAQPRLAIANGNDISIDTFIGVTLPVTGLVETYNLASGVDQSVSPAPSYYTFTSSNPGVASVSEAGIITVNTAGTAVITATLNGLQAEGSLTVNSLGNFQLAPVPTRNPDDVTSIFSDVYTNTPVDFFNGFWEPFQTTLSADFAVDGDNILNYTNFNFVGNQFANPTVDATEKSNLHVNMYIPADIPSDLDFLITIKDFGADQADGGGDDTIQQVFFFAADFTSNTWATLEIPITMANRNNIGLIIYENINNPTTSSIENFYLDNIYFYVP
ncbi:Ig-like domain-containing protein [Winogradskyella sp.]|nr:Ig-like domain-containing protein [Winogradskyella sp.]MDC1505333.1 Ig-like domain-containing protein [Winogradskyella sp.]